MSLAPLVGIGWGGVVHHCFASLKSDWSLLGGKKKYSLSLSKA